MRAGAKLDRFLVDREWHHNFSKKLIQWGQISLSNHCPILLTRAERNWGPKPFRFVDAWLKHPIFEDVVENFWKSFQIQGCYGFKLLNKFLGLKAVVKDWNIKVFGNFGMEIKKDEEQLFQLGLC